MNRQRADAVVGTILAVVLVGGIVLTWQTYRRRAVSESMGSMMDSPMGGMYAPSPLLYVFGTLLVVAVIGGGYLMIREDLTSPSEGDSPASERSSSSASSAADPGDVDGQLTGVPSPETHSHPRVLDVVPDDERQILEPILDSPGITQIALRDRSGFSKSKVSQTVSDLEKRGLVTREKQGRTYRIYPSDDLQKSRSNS